MHPGLILGDMIKKPTGPNPGAAPESPKHEVRNAVAFGVAYASIFAGGGAALVARGDEIREHARNKAPTHIDAPREAGSQSSQPGYRPQRSASVQLQHTIFSH